MKHKGLVIPQGDRFICRKAIEKLDCRRDEELCCDSLGPKQRVLRQKFVNVATGALTERVALNVVDAVGQP